MEEKYEAALKCLKKHNQEHILKNYEKLSETKKEKLLNQILTIDLNQIGELYESTKKEINFANDKIEPIDYVEKAKLSKEDFEKYKQLGENAIKQGKYAVVTMAGGQGTRLGHTGPKGTFKVCLKTGEKYLFQIIVESLQKANEKYGVVIPWYIMTSEENNDQTLAFLEEHNYFGYPKKSVKLFKQGKAPLVSSKKGTLLINKDKLIKEASDGNGSIYKSLKKDGILEDMKNKGVEWVFVGGVDNILLKIVDPLLVGITISQNNKIA